MKIVHAAAHLEEVEGVVHEFLGCRAGLERSVIKRASVEASQAGSNGGARVFIFEVQFYQRREAKAQTVGIGLGKSFPQDFVEQETRLEVGAGGGVFDPANAIAQVEFFGALLDRTQQALQAAAQVRRLADVRLSLFVAAKQEHGGSGRGDGEDFGIAFRREFQALGQHEIILVRIEKKSTTEALRHGKLRFSLSVKNRWKPGPANLSKAGAAELLAEVFAFHPDDAAHFVQT